MVLYSGLLALLFIVCKDFADIVALRFAKLLTWHLLGLTSRRFFYGFQVVTEPLFIMICGMWYVESESHPEFIT
jgi:ACS family allantoate permease-like MFS transporter